MRLQKVLAKAIALAAFGLQLSVTASAAEATGEAQQLVSTAAAAMGGVDRLQAVRNLTLFGYGIYATQHGGQDVTADPEAPKKLTAANELSRVYDLENNRYRMQERRNMLFSYAVPGAHNYTPINRALDGRIAYDILPDGRLVRIGPNLNSSSFNSGADGPRERRMWMHASPVVAIRAALDPKNRVGNVRQVAAETLFDLTLAEGDVLTVAVTKATGLPKWVSFISPHPNFGEVVYRTVFTGYLPFNGLMLPMGYNTKIDWRDTDYLWIHVDTYAVNSAIDDIKAPAEMVAAVEPVQTYKADITPIARGLWRITGGTMVVEFADHMTLYEINDGPVRAEAVIAAAKTIRPDKPLTQLIVSHNHFDHSAGLRTAVANGLTIIARRENEALFRELTERRAPHFPDAQERTPKEMKFLAVDDHLQLKDSANTLDIYHVIANSHMADAVFAYLPEHKITMEADLATAAPVWQWWGYTYRDNVEYRKLDVVKNVPVHMEVMSYQETLDMIEGGLRRAQDFCREQLAKGIYFPTCQTALTW